MKVAIAGGGTGGHLFPGLAVAELARDSGVADEVVFFGAERGIESWAVPKAGFELVAEKVHGIAGGSPLAALRSLGEMLAATRRARSAIRRRAIDVVIGLGGYASAPAVLAARSLGVPVVLLEQNRRPGISNRALGRLATRICTSFESTASSFPTGRSVLTGNPLRKGFEIRPPHAGRDLLLVFGGSAGARSLNRAMTTALAELAGEAAASGHPERGSLPPILHQVGKPFVDEVRAAYAKANVTAEVTAFIDDMPSVYARARLAVCRAGATSLAELIATGTPSVLVPLATSAGDHQLENARELEASGAAQVVIDDNNCAAALARALKQLLPDDSALRLMSDRAAAMGRPGAAQRVLDVVVSLAGTRHQR
ncbi:MAG TPA: undecaprenyldiphospho-muramoylpentapeptide beta-N-acetylglucosaminyltransferase [Candidatus Limnocylindrales bacterium]|nr:undecaprenyldiphospho-muramoylpentapeptide beta-N-acetylglucosaminyltransferase [Candidatus Limnocylindrales bacterium]